MFVEQPLYEQGAPSPSVRTPGLLEGLKRRQSRLQSALDKVNQAVGVLEKNPEIVTVIEKIAKVRGL